MKKEIKDQEDVTKSGGALGLHSVEQNMSGRKMPKRRGVKRQGFVRTERGAKGKKAAKRPPLQDKGPTLRKKKIPKRQSQKGGKKKKSGDEERKEKLQPYFLAVHRRRGGPQTTGKHSVQRNMHQTRSKSGKKKIKSTGGNQKH